MNFGTFDLEQDGTLGYLQQIDPSMEMAVKDRPGFVSNAISITSLSEHHFVATICGIIGSAMAYEPLIALLISAPEQAVIEIMLDTPGGNLTTAITIASAMHHCKGKVTVYAIGQVQSAGSFIFAFAPNHVVLPGAQFMYHGAIVGMQEKIGTLRDFIVHIESYTNYLLERSVQLGILTKEEATSIGTDQLMKHLTGEEVAKRMSAMTAPKEITDNE